MADISRWNLADVKKDLIIANRECSQRRLLHSAKWYVLLHMYDKFDKYQTRDCEINNMSINYTNGR